MDEKLECADKITKTKGVHTTNWGERSYARSPRMRRANCMSFGIIVTRLA